MSLYATGYIMIIISVIALINFYQSEVKKNKLIITPKYFYCKLIEISLNDYTDKETTKIDDDYMYLYYGISDVFDRYISIIISTGDGALIVKIDNSYNSMAVIYKRRAFNRRYVIENIDNVVNKYGGSYTVEKDDSRYTAITVIPQS